MLKNKHSNLTNRTALKSKRFSIAVPDDLAEWLEDQAKKDGRSRNNFIVKVLRDKKEKPQ